MSVSEQNSLSVIGQTSQNLFKFHKTRPTIALLLNNIDNPIHNAQWQGVSRAAQEYGFNLVCFTGSVLHYSKDFNEQANMVYELCDVNQFDGVILWMSNVGSLLNDEEMAAFVERFRSLPVVCCERTVAGIPCLLQKDYEGMFQAVEHLVYTHHYRKIVFIRGPRYHTGAQERYKAYQDVLAKYNIPLDNRLITEPGTWWDGESAVKQLLARYQLKAGEDFDALAGASWSMVFMAMQVFRTYGWQAPDNYAAIGYYDPPETRASQPTLTTVRSPIYELGKQAVLLIKEQLAGKKIPLCTYLPTTLIIRESCGCKPPIPVKETLVDLRDKTPYLTEEPPSPTSFQLPPSPPAVNLLPILVGKILQQTEYDNEAAIWLTPLMAVFLENINTKDQENGEDFLNELSKLVHRLAEADNDFFISNLLRGISWLRVNAEIYFPELKLPLVNRLCDRTLLVLANESEKIASKRQNDWERFHSLLHEMETDIVNICELEDLIHFLSTYLPRFDIPACYIALFKEHRPYRYRHAAPRLSTLLFAFQNNKIIAADTMKLVFPSGQLLPHGLIPDDANFTAVVESLYSRREQIGFVVFETGPRKGKVYNNLRYLISNAVEQVLLFETEQKTEKALANYTLELARTNSELVRSNKELEFFTYTASHDLLEPLRMVKSYLELIKKRYYNKLEKQVTELMNYAQDGAERMELMINDLLAYARITAQPKPFEAFDCRELVQEVLSNLKASMEEQGAVIRYDDLPVLAADKKQLRHVFQNLISNALKFRSANPPLIQIQARYKERLWEFSVIDNGIGIDAAHHERIFMIFQRLYSRHEYAGTGIGLAICKKIIEQHGGRIWVNSVVGEGATFFFTIPDRLQAEKQPS